MSSFTMPTIPVVAHLSSSSSSSNRCLYSCITPSNVKKNVGVVVKCASSFPQQQHKHHPSSTTTTTTTTRRSLSLTLLLLHILSVPKHAMADGVLDKYVKRKKLEPLESYVPAVLLTQSQFKDLERVLEADQPQYAACRSLLRSGPASSLRLNIRAVAQYASDGGDGKAAFSDVDQCLRALEDLDSLLLRASRNDRKASVETMKAKIEIALGALDSLLQTVPSAVLDKGKVIVDAYKIQEDVEPENLDSEMKQLESIL